MVQIFGFFLSFPFRSWVVQMIKQKIGFPFWGKPIFSFLMELFPMVFYGLIGEYDDEVFLCYGDQEFHAGAVAGFV